MEEKVLWHLYNPKQTQRMAIFQSLLHFLFPEFCPSCQKILLEQEADLCNTCRLSLPLKEPENMETVTHKLSGKIPFEHALAGYKYEKGNSVQKIIYALKYKKEEKWASTLVNWCYESFREELSDCDAIVPVPLHPKKQKIRGYNQSERIAVALSSLSGIPVHPLLTRTVYGASQTQKSRIGRYESLETVYAFNDNTQNKRMVDHALIVDDIITTGATLEVLGKILLDHGVKRISVFALAESQH
jgi:ComF family protein